jgi:glycerol-3-phosphate dehydrogenase
MIQLSIQDTDSYEIPPAILAQIKYSIVEEMTVKPEDFFIRRTGALYFDIHWVNQWKEKIIAWMGKQFNWSTEEKGKYTDELEKEIKAAGSPNIY